MSELHNEISSALNESGERVYTAPTHVSVYLGSESKVDVEERTVKAAVQYTVDMHDAPWGLEGITIASVLPFQFNVVLDGEPVTVEVPADTLSVNFTRGSSLSVEGVDVNIDEQGNFVSGEISFTYPVPVAS